MIINKKTLEECAYSSDVLLNDTIAKDRTFSGNYCNASIKRMKLTDCQFNGAKFNNAAVTGSSFYNCSFQQCDMDQGDFEYCDFYRCDISSETPISIAFDNSNFVETKIYDLIFYSSTFSNAFFDESIIRNVKIQNCTLESATFQKCQFENVDLSNLNLDFVDFRFPCFEKSILPMSQIVYTYGLLQYLMTTDDDVVIRGNGREAKPNEYINQILPDLLERYLTMPKEDISKVYFPLINVYLSLNEKKIADKYLEKALNLSASIQDFRMMKHYCKLINLSEQYTSVQKKKIFQRICNCFHPSIMTPWQLKDYSRNIGDIKYILLAENNFPTLVFNILTDIYHTGIDRLGILIKDIFDISDRYTSSPQKDIRVELSRNSPIVLSVQFTESAENISLMLNELILLCCYCVHENQLYEKEGSPLKGHLLEKCNTNENILIERLSKYKHNQLSFVLSDFYIENWKQEYNQLYKIPIAFVNSRI